MIYAKHLTLALLTLTFIASQTFAKSEKLAVLHVGDTAPAFIGTDDRNKKWDSKEKAGKKIYVLYFFPADMTPGCTKQACGYRDALAKLERKDVEVIGISGDAVENHQHFKKEYKLTFTLLADTDGKIAEAFGVTTGKGASIKRMIAGEELTLVRGVTASRWTFVIDKNWRIVHKDTKVNAAKDSETVLKVIEKLK